MVCYLSTNECKGSGKIFSLYLRLHQGTYNYTIVTFPTFMRRAMPKIYEKGFSLYFSVSLWWDFRWGALWTKGYPIKYPLPCFFRQNHLMGVLDNFFHTGTYTGIGTSVSSQKHVMKSTTKSYISHVQPVQVA